MCGCFSHSFNGRTEMIHETKTWPRRSTSCPVIILRYKSLFILIRFNTLKYRQDFEKSLHNFKQIICRYKRTRAKSKSVTSSQSIGCQAVPKRCLIGLQKGVGNTLIEHLLQVNQASFRSQKGMCQFGLHENSLQIPMTWE